MSITVLERPAIRTEGFLFTISRDEARESEERPHVKKQLFRCARQPNEADELTTSPVKPVLNPTLHDHREWQGAEIENMRSIACMPKEQVAWFSKNDVKTKFDDQENELRQMKQQMDEQKQTMLNMQKKVEDLNQLQVWLEKRGASLDALVQAYEDKQITWSVECGNRVLEILDKEVHKVTGNMEGGDPKMSYIILVRSLERSLENESVVVSAEKAVIALLHHVADFPKDTGTLRKQMLAFFQAREYRHSVTHMRYKEGGEQMLQNVSKVEDWMKQQVIPMVSTFSGVVAGGISLIRDKQEPQEETKNKSRKPASPKLQGKKQTTELVVRSTFGSRLFVVKKDDPVEKKIPLFVNAKGEWTAKLPRKEDSYYLLGVEGASVHRGPDFTVDPQLKKCFKEWEPTGKAKTATTTEGEMAWLGHIVTVSVVSLVLFRVLSSMKQ